jgi:hypothetical protein
MDGKEFDFRETSPNNGGIDTNDATTICTGTNISGELKTTERTGGLKYFHTWHITIEH